ncbi:DUF6339 family protein [Kibdelosporangium phytohabitans]|uniref:Uncharacterized protein n=1 Tax=Kibdelosporangium phytohabitans TaxID=860235 RepID=A0A0N9IE14_9PSEU|nr:DUF6339 family protein [Kibdelosporangium phytohabitans]ALG13364.1 hypothetical protein AOZ06_46690 [Kibdelosporangium phytohabitans]MBE1465150.1 hypothetical protein [Kibdelosporangium phytohabitans]
MNSPSGIVRIGLLSDAAVAKYLTHGAQAGQESPPLVALHRAATDPPAPQKRWDVWPVRELLDEAVRRFEDSPTEADAWLAPRLHATLRMTRAEAADSRRWNYLSMLVAPDYVVWRHKRNEIAESARFSGPHYTQAFSRLWWAAELFRDGDDYRPAEFACGFQDVLNTTMRLDVIDHRPTAIAIIRVLEKLKADGVSRMSDRVNALSSAVNAAGSTLVYDVIATDDPVDNDALQEWIEEAEHMPPVPWDRLPDGPDDGMVNENAVNTLVPLFEKLLQDAPLRHRRRGTRD